jgi:molybdate transport system regulatory protein
MVTQRKSTQGGLHLRIRVMGKAGDALGPGKAQLLEAVARTGSLRQAAMEMEMSYMKAWRLANAMNTNFREPLLEKNRGGNLRGGTQLTALGQTVLASYHRMTFLANQAAQKEWKVFAALLKK